ncbi:MAG: 4-phosphoerythronate dehydrogenase [Bacteroidales bacterium]
MKIIIDNKIPFIQGVFEPYARVEYVDAANFTPSLVTGADALVIRTRTRCNAHLLAYSNIRFIASATIGYDHIDADFCHNQSMQWTNASGCNSGAVEQYIAAALLALAKKHNLNLQGKKMGIIGLGNVGKRIASLAKLLGMQVLQNDPPLAQLEGSANFIPLADLLTQSDVVSLHVPLIQKGNFATFHLADTNFFSHLKPNAIFINTSRGEVVDEFALKTNLLSKHILACALDVWENEPCIDLQLLSLVDIGTPHIAGYSAEGKALATQMAVQAIGNFFKLPLAQWQHPKLDVQKNPLCINAEGKSVQELFFEITQQIYNIWNDDNVLRLNPLDGDQIRGNYNYRRDFSAYSIALHNANDEQQKVISQLFTFDTESHPFRV